MHLLDLDHVEAQLQALRSALPEATILYAVKANPHSDVPNWLSRALELNDPSRQQILRRTYRRRAADIRSDPPRSGT
jgi:hypothetical protein